MRHKEAVERFQREARVAAKVTSEHVARVHDVGALPLGEPFIVMEYLDGVDLRGLLDRGPLPVAEACEIALQACEALAQVHAAGIVHRDLKPSNLFITRRPDGSACVKLLDFGISKFGWDGERGTDPALTATATIMGSPSYMSPEQLKSTKEVDARTDVWSLGAVLYEALAGRPAFRGETVPQVCAMIASDTPPSLASLRPEVPERLDQAVLACLEKDPDRRARLVDLARTLVSFAPERARASLERIEGVLGEGGVRSRPSGSSSISPTARGDGSEDALPVLPLASSGRARTLSSSAWGSGRGRRASGGRLGLLVLVLVSGAAVAALSGRVDLRSLGGTIAGATSAVASAVGAQTAAAGEARRPASPGGAGAGGGSSASVSTGVGAGASAGAGAGGSVDVSAVAGARGGDATPWSGATEVAAIPMGQAGDAGTADADESTAASAEAETTSDEEGADEETETPLPEPPAAGSVASSGAAPGVLSARPTSPPHPRKPGGTGKRKPTKTKHGAGKAGHKHR